MNKFSGKFAALVLLAGLMLGCGGKISPLVGIWTREVKEQPTTKKQPKSKGNKKIGHGAGEMDSRETGMAIYIFAKTGEGKITEKGNSRAFRWEEEGKQVMITYDGEPEPVKYTYIIEGENLTLQPSEGEAIILTHASSSNQNAE